ncbi:MAG TPA: hypothetical protein VFX96_00795 [Pyrinomonadaceae bacterium]|nr:hypothetical protein [Pyrinomonadaceae bacterium]
MAVVINEFEVVVEPPARGESAAEQPAAAAAPQGATPHDLELINRRLEERAARVHAD